MRVTSSSFTEGGRIGDKETHLPGQPDTSPPLAWQGAPEGTGSFALLCIDHHPIARGWVHWVIFDIPASKGALPGGVEKKARLEDGARQGRNGFGALGWAGPMPPPGTGEHEYVFTLYALDVEKLGVPGETPTAEQVKKAMEGHVLAEGRLTGLYSR